MSAYNVSASAGIWAASLTQVAGLGTTTLTGAVETSGFNSNGNGLELVTNNLVVNDSLTSHNHPISLRSARNLTVSATSSTVVDSGTSPIWLTADSDNNGAGTLILNDNVTVTLGNTNATAVTLNSGGGIGTTTQALATGRHQPHQPLVREPIHQRADPAQRHWPGRRHEHDQPPGRHFQSNSDNAGSFISGPAAVNLDPNRGVTLGSAGGTFRVWNNGFVTVNGVVSGTGLLSKTDLGTLGLMGPNTYSGKTSVTDGILSINSTDALGSGPGDLQADYLTLNGGTLANMTTASFFTGGNNISLGVNRGVTLGAAGGGFRTGYGFTITIDSVISGSGNLGKTDGVAPSGVLLLNAANTFTGDTDWFASGSGRGVIKLGHALALQNSTVVMDTGTDGALNLNGLDNVVLGGLADNGANQGNVTIPVGKTLKVGNNSNPTTYLGSLSGAGGPSRRSVRAPGRWRATMPPRSLGRSARARSTPPLPAPWGRGRSRPMEAYCKWARRKRRFPGLLPAGPSPAMRRRSART